MTNSMENEMITEMMQHLIGFYLCKLRMEELTAELVDCENKFPSLMPTKLAEQRKLEVDYRIHTSYLASNRHHVEKLKVA